MNNAWQLQLRYSFFGNIIHTSFGNFIYWKYARQIMLSDEFRECMADLVGCYCMGGEL